MKIKLTILPILLIIAAPLWAVTLKWDIPEGSRLEVLRTAQVKMFENDTLSAEYEERNIIDLTSVEEKKKASQVKGLFSVYQRNKTEEVFNLIEQYPSEFLIDETGYYTVDEKSYMPNMRNVPTFPEQDIEVGQQWSAPMELVIEVLPESYVVMTMDAQYALVEVKEFEGKTYGAVEYTYKINEAIEEENLPEFYPRRIAGVNQGIIIWDIDGRQPVRIDEEYGIVFQYDTGDTIGYQMVIETNFVMYEQVSEEEKERAQEELSEELPEMDVKTDERGLVLRMGEVFFDFNSYNLRADTMANLDKVIKVLKKKYPGREIIVEGHTDNTGDENYNQALSKSRAKTVAEYLQGGTGHDKFSYKGFGEEEPIYDNSTSEGRKQNRRVDIIIKLN